MFTKPPKPLILPSGTVVLAMICIWISVTVLWKIDATLYTRKKWYIYIFYGCFMEAKPNPVLEKDLVHQSPASGCISCQLQNYNIMIISKVTG